MRTSKTLPFLTTLVASLPAQWTEASPAQSPSPRRAGAMAYDPLNNRMMIYGGLIASPSQSINETWVYTTTWQQLVSSAPNRWGHRMVTRTTDNRIYGFGGRSPSITGLANDTFRWNGSAWANIATTNAPSPRFLYGLAYDSARDRIVLFGGRNNSGANAETWEFDGTNWSQVTTASAPAPREEMGMVFDPTLGRVVLFGGCDEANQTIYGDTWWYDGNDWLDVTPLGSPTPRFRGAMVFDSTRSRSIYFGGFDGTNRLDETLEYAGDEWLLISGGSTLPTNTTETYHGFNPNTGKMIVYGGFGGTFSDATYEYEGTNSGLFSVFGDPCDTASGTPGISGTTPTIGQPLTVTFDNLGAAFGTVVVIGLSNQVFAAGPLPFDLGLLGLPGCQLLVSNDLLEVAASVAGSATYVINIPSQTNLVAQSVFFQGLVIDILPNLTFNGATQGGRALIGQ